MSNPLISICIPVYKSEPSLRRCLESVAAQEFEGFEIVVVNDGSPSPKDKKQSCKKIVNQFRKDFKLSKEQLVYREHKSNLGLLEARRTLAEAATGQYLFMLDSDDALLPGALKTLYETAINTGADIVHAQARVVCSAADGVSIEERVLIRQKEMQVVANKVFAGTLTDNEIFKGFLVDKKFNGFLWGKLYKRELYLQALSHIPFTHCVFSEDFLQFFFISYEAKKYVGIATQIYEYYIDTGISSFTEISDLKRWEQICSSANVFTILFDAVKTMPPERFSSEHRYFLGQKSRFTLYNILTQMYSEVSPAILQPARDLLCQYWGQSFVEIQEARLPQT